MSAKNKIKIYWELFKEDTKSLGMAWDTFYNCIIPNSNKLDKLILTLAVVLSVATVITSFLIKILFGLLAIAILAFFVVIAMFYLSHEAKFRYKKF